MVFQSYGLWPHMDVRGNIMLPLRRGNRRVTAAEAKRRLGRVVDLLRLDELVDRPVSMLSGGQQQRVALARALALEPAVLLMDEPLSNLDAKLRARLRVELKELIRQIGITTLYVTHDQAEAMVMGDRIAVMSRGRILQEGAGEELYQRPQVLEVAKFLGEMNFLRGEVVGLDGGSVQVRTASGAFLCRACGALSPGQKVEVGFRPEDAALTAAESAIAGEVTARYYLGDAYLYEIASPSGPVTARVSKVEDEAWRGQSSVRLALTSCVAFASE
jgi:ABC-type Fe3+/spermidine/putrescine transport system ATPase subunit